MISLELLINFSNKNIQQQFFFFLTLCCIVRTNFSQIKLGKLKKFNYTKTIKASQVVFNLWDRHFLPFLAIYTNVFSNSETVLKVGK